MPTIGDDKAPAIPAALGDVFLRASARSWYIRWNGEGTYVGSDDGRKDGALLGIELIEKMLSSPGWESSPTQLLGLLSGHHPAFSPQDRTVVLGNAYTDPETDGGIEANIGFGTTTLSSDVIARQVRRYIQSAQALIAIKLPKFADYLKATILPPSKGALVWLYQRERSDEYVPDWTFGSLADFLPSDRESSNVFCRESVTDWYIRFGTHECRVPHSEGIELLSVLLLHPTRIMSADLLCAESGCFTKGTSSLQPQAELRGELEHLVKRAKEFRTELMYLHENQYEDENSITLFHDLPSTPNDLIAALIPVVPKLREAAIKRRAQATLRAQGVAHSTGEMIAGTFEELCAKMKRCEALIRDLRDWEVQEQNTTTDRSDAGLRRRISASIRDTIDQIATRNPQIGAYLKFNFRNDKCGFVMNIATHWRVTQALKSEFSTA